MFLNWKTLSRLVCGGLLMATFSIPKLALALKVEEVPSPQLRQGSWITDVANVLSPETEREINQLLSLLTATNGIEIAVVTVPKPNSLSTPKEFANALFHHWKIGRKGQESGLLFLIYTESRIAEIKIGNGIKQALSDDVALNILTQQVLPQIRQRNFDKGTLIGTKALVANLMPIVTNSNRQSLNVANTQRQNTDLKLSLFLLGLGSIMIAIVIVSYWYYLAKKTQRAPNEQPEASRSRNSSKTIQHTNKPRSISAQPKTESATDLFEVGEVPNWVGSYYSQQDRNDSSSNYGSGGYDNSSSHDSNSHDSSSSDCGSSYDSSSDSSSSSSDSSW